MNNSDYLAMCRLINNSDLSYTDKFKLRRTAYNMFVRIAA